MDELIKRIAEAIDPEDPTPRADPSQAFKRFSRRGTETAAKRLLKNPEWFQVGPEPKPKLEPETEPVPAPIANFPPDPSVHKLSLKDPGEKRAEVARPWKASLASRMQGDEEEEGEGPVYGGTDIPTVAPDPEKERELSQQALEQQVSLSVEEYQKKRQEASIRIQKTLFGKGYPPVLNSKTKLPVGRTDLTWLNSALHNAGIYLEPISLFNSEYLIRKQADKMARNISKAQSEGQPTPAHKNPDEYYLFHLAEHPLLSGYAAPEAGDIGGSRTANPFDVKFDTEKRDAAQRGYVSAKYDLITLRKLVDKAQSKIAGLQKNIRDYEKSSKLGLTKSKENIEELQAQLAEQTQSIEQLKAQLKELLQLEEDYRAAKAPLKLKEVVNQRYAVEELLQIAIATQEYSERVSRLATQKKNHIDLVWKQFGARLFKIISNLFAKIWPKDKPTDVEYDPMSVPDQTGEYQQEYQVRTVGEKGEIQFKYLPADQAKELIAAGKAVATGETKDEVDEVEEEPSKPPAEESEIIDQAKLFKTDDDFEEGESKVKCSLCSDQALHTQYPGMGRIWDSRLAKYGYEPDEQVVLKYNGRVSPPIRRHEVYERELWDTRNFLGGDTSSPAYVYPVNKNIVYVRKVGKSWASTSSETGKVEAKTYDQYRNIHAGLYSPHVSRRQKLFAAGWQVPVGEGNALLTAEQIASYDYIPVDTCGKEVREGSSIRKQIKDALEKAAKARELGRTDEADALDAQVQDLKSQLKNLGGIKTKTFINADGVEVDFNPRHYEQSQEIINSLRRGSKNFLVYDQENEAEKLTQNPLTRTTPPWIKYDRTIDPGKGKVPPGALKIVLPPTPESYKTKFGERENELDVVYHGDQPVVKEFPHATQTETKRGTGFQMFPSQGGAYTLTNARNIPLITALYKAKEMWENWNLRDIKLPHSGIIEDPNNMKWVLDKGVRVPLIDFMLKQGIKGLPKNVKAKCTGTINFRGRYVEDPEEGEAITCGNSPAKHIELPRELVPVEPKVEGQPAWKMGRKDEAVAQGKLASLKDTSRDLEAIERQEYLVKKLRNPDKIATLSGRGPLCDACWTARWDVFPSYLLKEMNDEIESIADFTESSFTNFENDPKELREAQQQIAQALQDWFIKYLGDGGFLQPLEEYIDNVPLGDSYKATWRKIVRRSYESLMTIAKKIITEGLITDPERIPDYDQARKGKVTTYGKWALTAALEDLLRQINLMGNIILFKNTRYAQRRPGENPNIPVYAISKFMSKAQRDQRELGAAMKASNQPRSQQGPRLESIHPRAIIENADPTEGFLNGLAGSIIGQQGSNLIMDLDPNPIVADRFVQVKPSEIDILWAPPVSPKPVTPTSEVEDDFRELVREQAEAEKERRDVIDIIGSATNEFPYW